jgi:hypothetical protein
MAKQIISESIYFYIKKKRKNNLKYSSAALIQKVWRAKYYKHSSFIKALNLKENCDILFLKEQKNEFI